jgi:hypothetical protein
LLNQATCPNLGAVELGTVIQDLQVGGVAAHVDDVTLEVNISDEVQIKDGGVDTAQLAAEAVTKAKVAADVAGAGLEQGGDGSLEVEPAGTLGAIAAYLTAEPGIANALVAAAGAYLDENPAVAAALVTAMGDYLVANPDAVATVAEAIVHALAANGNLHAKGSDYTPGHPVVDISFEYDGTTYHAFLYSANGDED